MSALSEQPAFTRLRDFGAFQPDISELPTNKVIAVQVESAPKSVVARLSGRLHITEISPEISTADPMIAIDGSVVEGIASTAVAAMSAPVVAVSAPEMPQPAQDIAGTGHLAATHLDADCTVVVTRSKGSVFDTFNKAALRKGLIFAIRVGITVLLFAWLIRSLSWSTLMAALARVQIEGVLVALVIGAGGVVVSAYQWHGLLRTESIRYDLAELVKLYLVGISFSHFLPTGMGGDAVKALYVGQASGNKTGSACAVILCRFTGFLGMLLIMFPVLVIWHVFLAPELMLSSVLLSLFIGLLACLALLLTALLPEIVRRKSGSKWAQSRLLAPIIVLGDTLRASIGRPFSLSGAVLCGALFWGLAILNCYSYAHALGIVVPLYFYCVAVPLIGLVSFLPISINGFGVRESAFVYVFSTLHIAPVTSLLLAFLLDAQAIGFALIGGCLYLLVLRQRFKALFS